VTFSSGESGGLVGGSALPLTDRAPSDSSTLVRFLGLAFTVVPSKICATSLLGSSPNGLLSSQFYGFTRPGDLSSVCTAHCRFASLRVTVSHTDAPDLPVMLVRP
jgi:hypothetical protein